MANLQEFLHRKIHESTGDGFEPLWMPDWLFPFQQHLVRFNLLRGRSATFADCGLGKTPMQLVSHPDLGLPVEYLTP